MRSKKTKKKLISFGTILLLIIVLVVVIVLVVKNNSKKPGSEGGGPVPEDQETVYGLPNVEYSDMQVTNVEMEYLKDNDETMISMQIDNTSEVIVENETLNVILINGEDEVINKMQTYIKYLDIGQQYDISVILKGDLTSTKQIKLEKVSNEGE